MNLLFYLGTPEPSWLRRSHRLPLFVSHRRLKRLARLHRAATPWALDSGGFSELDEYGCWQTSAHDYVAAVARYDREIGGMEWAAPQDWMCEAKMLAKTGLSAAEHIRRTGASVVELRELWPQYSDDTCPIIPVVQGRPGWIQDYLDCAALLTAHGIDLAAEPLVGLGSVCRQENTAIIGETIAALVAAYPGIALHGFGVKAGGLRRYGHLLASADSQAWSRGARHRDVRMPECVHAGSCNWCARHALNWRRQVRTAAGQPADVAWFTEHGVPPWQPVRAGEAA